VHCYVSSSTVGRGFAVRLSDNHLSVPGIGVRPYALAGGGVSFANARRPGGQYQIWIPCRRSTRTGQVSSGTTVLPSAHREFNDILRRHIGSNHQHWATIMTIVLLGTW
jgi:hypothetical protein